MALIITYLLFFIGIFFEGEIVLLSAILAAHQGYLNLWIVISIAVIGTISSDLVWFYLGRNSAKKWLTKKNFRWNHKIQSVNQKLEKNRILLLVGYRFLYGLRMITPFALGMQKISFLKFIAYSLISTILWATIFISLGWFFGEAILNKIKHYQNIEIYIIIIAVSLLIVHFLIRRIKNGPKHS